MPSHSEKFMGCQIEISATEMLTIDGKPVATEKVGGEQWSSAYLPYLDYPSLPELARAIVRDTGEFREQKLQQEVSHGDS